MYKTAADEEAADGDDVSEDYDSDSGAAGGAGRSKGHKKSSKSSKSKSGKAGRSGGSVASMVGVGVKVSQELIGLSGGQNTLIALALIVAIQVRRCYDAATVAVWRLLFRGDDKVLRWLIPLLEALRYVVQCLCWAAAVTARRRLHNSHSWIVTR